MPLTSSEYITGITILDEQHAQLFHLADQAKALLKDENMLYKHDDLQKILKGLHDYTLSHFVTEESYMENASYAEIDAHKQFHQCFIQKMNELDTAAASLSLGNQDCVLLELVDYLTDWLRQHILNTDQQMVREIEAAK